MDIIDMDRIDMAVVVVMVVEEVVVVVVVEEVVVVVVVEEGWGSGPVPGEEQAPEEQGPSH